MKKLSLLAIAAVALVACGEQKPTPADFATIETEINNAASADQPIAIVALGAAGDYVISLPANEAVLAVAAKEKSAAFLSIENPAQYIAEGTCLLNIIPDNTMAAMNTPENKCNFRLFCGTAEDMAGEAYAVELCSE
jgi:hypothetical protein